MAYILKAGEKQSVDLMSSREKFKLLPPKRRHELLTKMSDEDVARLEYDWEYNGRAKQLAPNHAKSRATSFCMCKYLDAQSKTDKKLKLEQFPPCDPSEHRETLISYDPPEEDGWLPIVDKTNTYWVKEVRHIEPKVCQFRQNWSMWVLLAGRGFGKAIDVDTPIPTPNGWKKLNEIEDGDQVFDEKGKVVTVIKAHDQYFTDDVYEITFSDKSKIVADKDHLWTIWEHNDSKQYGRYDESVRGTFPIDWATYVGDKYDCHKNIIGHFGAKTLTTEELIGRLENSPRIPLTRPLSLEPKNLPIDPWILGYWLGNGDTKSGGVHTGSHLGEYDFDFVYSKFITAGYEVTKFEKDRSRDESRNYCGHIYSANLHEKLKNLGLLGNKHVPKEYLRGSYEQRLAILRGLMDSDGHAGNENAKNYVGFSSTIKDLADSVYELAISIGEKPLREEGHGVLYGVQKKYCWGISYRPNINPFSLPRKAKRIEDPKAGHQGLRHKHRIIKSIKKVEGRLVRCLTVSSESRLYLIGEQMVPTHNTRVGAELVREMVETGQAKRIAIISPTAADARDVVVEGESGLLNICPSWNKPIYESTKRRVTWSNGAIASLFSAEEPERLRGPQFDFAWCFIGDTLIATEFGEKPINEIKIGDRVWTRKGLKKVYNAQMTGYRPVFDVHLSNGKILTGTGEHKIWVDDTRWVELQNLFPGAILLAFQGDEKCQSFIKGSNTIKNSEDISLIETESVYIVSFMKKRTVQFLMVSRSIIKTVISTITNLLTSKRYLQATTNENTNSKDALQNLLKRRENTLIPIGVLRKEDTSFAKTVDQNSTRILTTFAGVLSNVVMRVVSKVFRRKSKILVNSVFVRNAKRSSLQTADDRIAQASVTTSDTSFQIRVLSVTPHSSQRTCNPPVQQDVGMSYEYSLNQEMENSGENFKNRIKKNGSQIEREVWNISVEDAHEYFANGVLVKNCDEVAGYDVNTQQMTFDMLQFGLRLGTNPRCVVTTTPKPTPLIQNFVTMAKNPENRVIVTTGSSYENRSNLAAPFMRQITQYEGTNLGRQEIYAELIDIEESGIIKRQWFKQWSSKKAMPMFEFVIQSYDTAFTERTENDPTGCLVFGVFRPGPDEPYCAMIIDAWTEHLKYPELRKRAQEDYKATYGDQEAKVDLMVIEDKGSGIPLIQDLQRAGLPIKKYNPGRPDKVMRLHAISHLIYNGRVYIPESKTVPGEYVTWAEPFLREVCAFPNSPHDEYVDCLSQGLAVFRDQEWLSIDPMKEKPDWEEDDDGVPVAYSNPYMT